MGHCLIGLATEARPRSLLEMEPLGRLMIKLFVKEYTFDHDTPLNEVLQHDQLVCVYNHGNSAKALSDANLG